MPAGDVLTYPHCGACGYNVAEYNVNKDMFCDSCGADVTNFAIIVTTTGTAGTPGSWDGIAPTDQGQLQLDGVVGDPIGAWSTGEYVWLGDRSSQVYWDGANFVLGIAP